MVRIKKVPSDVKMTDSEAKLLEKYTPYIFKTVKVNYEKLDDSIVEELSSQALYEVSMRMSEFDPTAGSFCIFVKNIISTAVANYYYRDILNYRGTTQCKNMNSENYELYLIREAENKEKHAKWEAEVKLWESQHDGETDKSDKPVAPVLKKHLVYIHNNTLSISDESSMILNTLKAEPEFDINDNITMNMVVESASKTLSPVKYEFFNRVFVHDEATRIASDKINKHINSIAKSISYKVEVLDDLECPRSVYFQRDYETTTDPIKKDFLYRVIHEKKSVEKIRHEMRARDGSFMHNKLVEDFKDLLNKKKGGI